LTALIAVGLTAFVLVTDGFGLGILVSTLLALVLQRLRLIGPCSQLLYLLSALLAVRAAWLLATTRRRLVIAVWRLVRSQLSGAARRLTPAGRLWRVHSGHRCCALHADGAPVACESVPRPE
jgi:hypothetical protein